MRQRSRPPRPSTALRRAAMEPSHRSLALSLGALDDALDGPTAARLSRLLFRVGAALHRIAKSRGEAVSPACELLAQLHDADHEAHA